MTSWLFPNPDYPFQIGRSIPVDLDSREPLRKEQADALSAEIERLTCERAELSERIRKINKRLLLSIEREEDDGDS